LYYFNNKNLRDASLYTFVMETLFLGCQTSLNVKDNGGLAHYRNQLLNFFISQESTQYDLITNLDELAHNFKFNNSSQVIHYLDPYGLSQLPPPIIELLTSNERSFITIPDVQDLDHPENFTSEVLDIRSNSYEFIKNSGIKIIALSNFTADKIYEKLKISRDRIKIVGCGLDRTKGVLSLEEHRKIKSLCLNSKLIIVPSKLWKHKGILQLLKVIESNWKTIFKNNIKIVFTGGDISDSDEISQWMRNSSLQSVVTRLGFLSDVMMTNLINHSSCLLFPSNYEGFGMPVGEAAFAGKPVAAFDIPTNIELLGDSYPLVSSSNFNDLLLLSIDMVNADFSKYENILTQTRQKLADMTWENIGRELIQCYESK
jgi:glycosyltransferase involved in cell wall biosynthesis